MEYIISLILGVSLSATCGFRIFIPPLVLSISYKIGIVALPHNYEWVKSDIALIILVVAAILEIAAYYIPAVDNILDTISVPLSFLAGTFLLVTFVNFDNDIINWVLAATVGGGAAGGISFGTASVRAVSTATTAGFGNWIVSTFEWVGSLVISIITIFLPIVSIILLAIILLGINSIRLKYKSKNIKS